jgi:AbrB family looped-hinge helix DNA binding protein
MVTTMDKKGKITIPKKIRKEGHFTEGTKFSVLKTEDGLIIIPLLSEEELEKQLLNKKQLMKAIEEHEREELELEN